MVYPWCPVLDTELVLWLESSNLHAMNSFQVRFQNSSGSKIEKDFQGWMILGLPLPHDVGISKACEGSGWNWSLGILGYSNPMSSQESMYGVLQLLFHVHSIGKIVP